MTAKRLRRGETHWVIDIRYTDTNGKRCRYRRDAELQTRTGKEAEERRIRENIAKHGSPYEPRAEPAPAVDVITFKDAAEAFMKGKAVSALKHTTRQGYRDVLDKRLIPRFGAMPLDAIGYEAVQRLDADIIGEDLSASSRRNVQITLRSVIRSAVDAGKLADMPKLPPLPKVGRTIRECLTAEQIESILNVAAPTQALAIALGAYAGLRAGEARALRWSDVDLRAGLIVVRLSHSKGEIGTPKSGHERKIPIAPPLRRILEAQKGRAGLVAVTAAGEPWGESGLTQAFQRCTVKAGIAGEWSYHSLRHFFITELFRRGGGAATIQALAGHASLAVTARYAHAHEADLRAAVGLLGNQGVTAPAPLSAPPG